MAGWGGSDLNKEDFEGNTTIFNILKSFNSFTSHSAEEQSAIEEPTQPSYISPQAQYEQMMKFEDQAGCIRSGARLLQVEREKMQMELSHKRARIEFEKEARTNAQNCEREADRNQELQKRIKQHQESLKEAEDKYQQQLEVNKTCQKNVETLNKKLQEKETKVVEANETISKLKGEMSKLQLNLMNQEMRVKSYELEKQELTEQLDVLHKIRQEANQQIQALQAREGLIAEKDQRIQELEQKLSLQEHDAIIVKNMKNELAQFPKMERELQQLREENAYLREMKDNNGLLKEEVESLRRKLERSQKVQAEQVALELENERLQRKLDTWEKLHGSTGLDIKTPDDLSRHIIALQQRELDLKEQNSTMSSRARFSEKARKQLQDELLNVQGQLLEERKKRDHQEAMARSLHKRVQLLIKAREGMRSFLESYESELNPSEHTLLLRTRVREAEEMVQKVEAHCAEMEVQLSQALEEVGNQKQRAEMLEAELQLLRSQASVMDPGVFIEREEVNMLRLKVEDLEAERGRLNEDKKALEMKLEQMTLQGFHDPSRTKVLHFSMNPATLAKQQQLEEQAQLRQECERLREMVRVLEAGGSLPENLEGAVSLPPSQEISELKKQIESAELKNQRLKEVFHSKIQEFRKACYQLTGYQIVMTSDNQYQLTSVYAEHKEDCLIFKASGSKGARMQLLETEFSKTVRELIELHLLQQDSIPAFLSALTLDLFSRQTVT